MKITCTLSEYTKLARQCGENKARFNCRNCPLHGVVELPEGENCDIERFVQAIILGKENTSADARRKALEEHTTLNRDAPDAISDAVKSALFFGARGEHLESR